MLHNPSALFHWYNDDNNAEVYIEGGGDILAQTTFVTILIILRVNCSYLYKLKILGGTN